MTKRQFKEMIDGTNIYPDKIIFKKDKTISFRFGFFYTFGKTAESYAEQIKKIFPHVEIINAWKIWRAWPKDSYFEVNCRF